MTDKNKTKNESVNENKGREIDKVYGDFEVLSRDFEKFNSLSIQIRKETIMNDEEFC